jgi:predicted TIM-barrel fold metal-dependent hydrolase
VDVAGQDRLKSFFLSNLIGNPVDTAIAACHLIFGGVLDRHPRLQICLPHGGGVLPILVGRIDQGWGSSAGDFAYRSDVVLVRFESFNQAGGGME